MTDLAGKGALVTGASGGIGAAIARRIACLRCATVGLSGTRTEPLEALAAELGRAGARAAVQPERTPMRSRRCRNLPWRRWGLLDILVNNAGITRDQLFMRMSDDDWAAVLDVNLTATMRLCRGVLRGMMKARWGRIVNISSVVGATGNPGQGNYAASKAGMVGMSKVAGL